MRAGGSESASIFFFARAERAADKAVASKDEVELLAAGLTKLAAEVKAVASEVKSVAGEVKSVADNVKAVAGEVKTVAADTKSVADQVKAAQQRVGGAEQRIDRVHGEMRAAFKAIVETVYASIATRNQFPPPKPVQERMQKGLNDISLYAFPDPAQRGAWIKEVNEALGVKPPTAP